MKNNRILPLLLGYALIALLTIIFFDGTGDAGDSVYHALFARYAPAHPELFFDHWAKPVYVLLASPFAQFGFVGVKFFNAIAALFTLFFTHKIAVNLELKNPLVAALILIFTPLSFVLTFSGLTEPLFALFLTAAIYCAVMNRFFYAAIIISFLPFVRSEGLIILGVFGLYFLLKKRWLELPVLLLGHLVYSVAGFFVYSDFFWVLNKIPYSKLSSTYGSGELSHFVEQLIYVVGIPIYVLFWIGVVALIWKSIKKVNLELHILVTIGFFAFLIAHSLFWYFGIFNSMGLKRVLVGVAPLISIIALIGFNFLSEELLKERKKPKLIVQCMLLGYVLIFPFTSNPAAVNWDKDLNLTQDQRAVLEVTEFITEHNLTERRFVYDHPYLSQALKIDHFDPVKRIDLTANFPNESKRGDLVIWDNWFSIVEYGIGQEALDQNPQLRQIKRITSMEEGREVIFIIYECI